MKAERIEYVVERLRKSDGKPFRKLGFSDLFCRLCGITLSWNRVRRYSEDATVAYVAENHRADGMPCRVRRVRITEELLPVEGEA